MTETSASFHRPEESLSAQVTEAFEALFGVFPNIANFQGLHFKYAANSKKGALLIETKRDSRYFYWLLVGERFFVVHASLQSKLKRMEPISEKTLVPSRPYEHAPNA
jgi:hypothetical protein